jgi:uncharacterized protein (TIGR03085 family)
MSAGRLAHSERIELCDLLAEVGPDAPTLCEGWQTKDLAAHLYVRERRPIAAPGLVLGGPFSSLTAREMETALRRLGYEGLISRVRTGPPLVVSLVDATINLVEMFVHHEDVRRAVPGFEPRQRPDLDDALWSRIGRLTLGAARRLQGTGLELERSDDGRRTVARSGGPVVVLSGTPQELSLYLTGRRSVAKVTLSGPSEARRLVEATRFGI